MLSVGADVLIGPHDTQVAPLERVDEDIGPYGGARLAVLNPPDYKA